ncbi:CRISPR-associated helicase Cas3' [Formicincola oecophyllae]
MGDGRDVFLPLHRHMLDVAAVFLELMQLPTQRCLLEGAAGTPLTDGQISRLAFLVALHDIGKVNSGFQFKIFPPAPAMPAPTGHVRQGWEMLSGAPETGFYLEHPCLTKILYDWCDKTTFEDEGPDSIDSLLLAVINHHGYCNVGERGSVRSNHQDHHPYSSYSPGEAFNQLFDQLHQAFPEAFEPTCPPLPYSTELQHHLNGLTSLADQVGSREADFPVKRTNLEPVAALADSRKRARQALVKLGLDVSPWRLPPSAPMEEAALFGWPGHAAASDMQQLTAQVTERVAVLESETGSGKTEAALMLFMRLFAEGKVDGLYFAIPTRAAASSLHRRVQEACKRLFRKDTILAVPGYVRFGQHEVSEHLPGFEVRWDDDPPNHEERWAAENARHFLAYPLAVGTIDQAMMGAMHVKWSHMRASALARSLLVVDEVHASDVYMTEIGRRLVQAHVKRGGHALLMSATLGAAARAEWLGTSPATTAQEREGVPYPCLTTLDSQGHERHVAFKASERQPPKQVTLQLSDIIKQPDAVAAMALEGARQGLRVLIIRNTVSAAQATFEALEAQDPKNTVPTLEVNGVHTLHHSRFSPEDRKSLDGAVEGLLGKHVPQLSQGCIVMGTQTLEQSLDIDADLLITDLCPVDVLLQRLGRLHRHQRRRPEAAQQARCLVLSPGEIIPKDTTMLAYGLGLTESGGVYRDLRMLEATRRLIQEKPLWTIPQDNRMLVERGTDPETLQALQKALAQAQGPDWNDRSHLLEGKQMAEGLAGQSACVERAKPYGQTAGPLMDGHFRTRLGLNSLTVTFSRPVPGPLGNAVHSLTIPQHMARKIFSNQEDDEGAWPDQNVDAEEVSTGTGQEKQLHFNLHGWHIIYDRTGVHMTSHQEA